MFIEYFAFFSVGSVESFLFPFDLGASGRCNGRLSFRMRAFITFRDCKFSTCLASRPGLAVIRIFCSHRWITSFLDVSKKNTAFRGGKWFSRFFYMHNQDQSIRNNPCCLCFSKSKIGDRFFRYLANGQNWSIQWLFRHIALNRIYKEQIMV